MKQVTGTFTLAEAILRVAALERRLTELEAEVAALRGDDRVDLREVGNVVERT